MSGDRLEAESGGGEEEGSVLHGCGCEEVSVVKDEEVLTGTRREFIYFFVCISEL